jgi:signal transduction histidine kinase
MSEHDESGRITGWFGPLTHISDPKRLDEERERLLVRERGAREQVTTIRETMTDAFFAVDREWRFTYVNREASLFEAAAERERLLERECKAREELERVSESRERLMRGFSHDLKNPLGAADGHTQLLEAGAPARSAMSNARASCRLAAPSGLRLVSHFIVEGRHRGSNPRPGVTGRGWRASREKRPLPLLKQASWRQ